MWLKVLLLKLDKNSEAFAPVTTIKAVKSSFNFIAGEKERNLKGQNDSLVQN